MSKPILALLLTLAVCHSMLAPAQNPEQRIEDMSEIDLQFMQNQRRLITDLAAHQLGRYFSGNHSNDLTLLQTLLDRQLVKPTQKRELQAMGIILGDLLAEDLELDWVIYVDKIGRSRALRYRKTEHYLFPVTMISRRREVGNEEAVAEIYTKAQESMRSALPSRPFE